MPQAALRHLDFFSTCNEPVKSVTVSSLSSAHRLDQALFWLRWLFLLSAGLLVWGARAALLDQELAHPSRLFIALGAAAGANLLIGLLAAFSRIGERFLGTVGILLDSALAAALLWVFDGALLPLVALGALAVVPAAYRFGWMGAVLAWLVTGAFSLFAISQLADPPDSTLVDWGLGLAFLLVFGLLGAVLRTRGRAAGGGVSALEAEAQRLRVTRERARAIYEMANTLSSTLDHRRVMDAAQGIGTSGLSDLNPDARVMSAVLLFQGKDNMLRVVSSRRLPRSDETVSVPGVRGILGLALKQAEPVFGGDAYRDPELRYFLGFQDAKSVLAIPLRSGFENYGVMVFGCEQPNAFSDEHVELMAAIGTQATISLQNAVLYQNLVIEKERIVEVEEDARKKLARDLHDGPTQSVAAIAMRVNYIRRLLERQPQQATEELWKVEDLARRTTKEIRHMLFTLRPLVLESQGLVAALSQLAEKMKDTHDTTVLLRGQTDIEQYLDTNAQGVLFYIIEEAVNNARKHAQSEQIWVRLYRREAYVVIEIEDDGVGFDVGAVDANYDQRGSLGMVNMRERAELIEGTLRVQSAKGRGTKISVLVPIERVGGSGAPRGEGGPAPQLNLQGQNTGARRLPADLDNGDAPND
jgi:signal transduction histidine kinase